MRLTANDVPVLRRNIAEWLSTNGPGFFETMILLGKQPIRPAGPNKYVANLLANAEMGRLRNADLWFFEPDLCELLAVSHPTMPSFVPTPMDLPSRIGFAMFANPISIRPAVAPETINNSVISNMSSKDHATELRIYNMITAVMDASPSDVEEMIENLITAVHAESPEHPRALISDEIRYAYQIDIRSQSEIGGLPPIEVYGVSWSPMAPSAMGRGPASMPGAGSAGGTWFSFYSQTRLDLVSDDPEILRQSKTFLPEYMIDNEAVVPWMPPGGDPSDYTLPSTSETTWGWARLVFAAFRLAAQRGLVEQDTTRTPRSERRRTARLGLPERDVRVARIRRTVHDSGTENGTGQGREYQHRWVVRGHWRNQWYPTVEAHRPIWISPHVKGPDDAPLIGGERVTSVGAPRVE
jgi:hypothetical protein